MKKHLLIIFVLLISKLAFGQNCLQSYTFTASPPPTNGGYAPGTTVTFCLNVTNFYQTNSNWLHGITPTFGPGWNMATISPGAVPGSCSGSGNWGWFPGGVSASSGSGQSYGAGFYYETASGNSVCGCYNGNPGDNFGDDNVNNCSWQFCITITSNTSCTNGTSLDVSFRTTGDWESGSWGSSGCQGDPIPTLNAICTGCLPPTMSSATATCTDPTGGTATATPAGVSSPWTYHWSTGTVQALSSASTITGLAQGNYGVTITDATGCTTSGAVSVGYINNSSAGPSQTVNCVVALPGGSATMAATGPAGTWTDPGTNPGTSTITTPSSATTTITNFSAAGTYTYTWTSGSCVNTDTVTVTATPNPGPAQTVSCAILPGGTATMAATGAGTWSQGGNPGAAIITTPGSPTTTITGFSAEGVYTFTWSNGSCSATTTVTVTAKPDAGPDQTISCAMIPGGTATMAGTGAGTWAPQTGNPGTATITSPTSPTTTITGFNASGTYYFIWTSGSSACTDTAAVNVTAQPNAGPAQTVTCAILPGGSATMAALDTGTWTPDAGNPGTAIITAPTSPTTTITTYTAPGVYTFDWSSDGCTSTTTVTVTAKPSAGPSDTVCLNTVPILNATGTGTWTAMPNNTVATTITAPGSGATYIIGCIVGNYGYIWTNGSGCADTTYVRVNPLPAVLTHVANISCTNATGVIWAGASGGTPPFTYQWSNSTGDDSLTTTTAGVAYTVTVTDVNQCTVMATDSVTNRIIIVGLTDSIQNVTCNGYSDGQIMINATPPATYTYVWSSGESGATITGLPPATNYTVTVTDSLGCSAVGGPYTVTSPTLDSLSITPPDSTMALGDTIQLWSTLTGVYPATSYSWTPSYGLSCDTCPDPLFIPVDQDTVRTVYTLTTTYYNGCFVTASDTLLARTNNLIAIPDAFSPNGDGINDIFYIPAWSVREFHMTIYNRWGTEVFETDDIHTGWDGTYRGAPQPSEVYTLFFTVSHFDGKTESHQGTVTLFR
jgi:gliding motility-associated-like protein